MIERRPLNIQKIRNILADIEGNLRELNLLVSEGLEKFLSERKNYGLAEHYLRRTLEGILTIGSHILSRLPAKTKDYKQIILSLGEYGIVPIEFAERNKRLASYRNRLVHLYWEVTMEELFTVITQHLEDMN
ncbi:MAG: type VII toxin-antitoxin system HepT family RNase toxin, partial [Thermodesulfovibrionales bacterium]